MPRNEAATSTASPIIDLEHKPLDLSEIKQPETLFSVQRIVRTVHHAWIL